MCKCRLDSNSRFPAGMQEYLEAYGWHFNKAMCEWAVSRMRDRNGNRVTCTKKDADELLARHGIVLKDAKGYDHMYVLAMAKADYWNSAIVEEARLALFVRDYMTDPDGYDEVAFTRFYADCIGKGEPIMWEDML